MDQAFAYSHFMQAVLFLISAITSLIRYYAVVDLVLAIYSKWAGVKQKLLYAFIISVLFNTVWTYGIYMVGGMADFTPLIYSLVTVPNPLFGLIYYALWRKIFKMSYASALRISYDIYLGIVIIKTLLYALGFFLFPQVPGKGYNYLLDACSLTVSTTVIVASVCFLCGYLRRQTRPIILMKERTDQGSLPWLSFKETAVYFCAVFLPTMMTDSHEVQDFITLAVLLEVLFIGYLALDNRSLAVAIDSKNVHIGGLTDTVESFEAVRRDFYSILSEYGQFIERGDLKNLRVYHESLLRTTVGVGDQMDLMQKMGQNPALISLLLAKLEYARQTDVTLRIALLCDVTNLYIDEVDICHVLTNLLDNAIESAFESEKKIAHCSIEKKPGGGILIVISNTVAESVEAGPNMETGVTSKPSHMGDGIAQVRSTLMRYSNAAVRFTQYDMEFSVFINIQPV